MKEKTSEIASIHSLPSELLFQIMTHLPHKDIFLLLLVSKSFQALVSREVNTDFLWQRKVTSLPFSPNLPILLEFQAKPNMQRFFNRYYEGNWQEKALLAIQKGNLTLLKLLPLTPKRLNFAGYVQNDFFVPKNVVSILRAAKERKNQAILDYLYQLVVAYYLTNNITNDDCGNSLLHWAVVCNQSAEIVKALIASGINVYGMNQVQCTPVSRAITEDNASLLKLFVEFEKNESMLPRALCMAVYEGRTESVKVLIEGGVALAGTSHLIRLWPPLVIAAEKGHKDIVNYLISKKADVNVIDLNCSTALIKAVKNHFLEIAKALLRN